MAKPKKPAKKTPAAKKKPASKKRAKKARAATSLDALVERELPGYRLAAAKAVKESGSDGANMKTRKGPSIAQLRAKFLGEGAKDAPGGAEPKFAPVDKSVKTVRVEPKSGGPAKTADIKNNKINIVQG